MKLVSLFLRLVMGTFSVLFMTLLFIVTVPLWILGGLVGVIALPLYIGFITMYGLSAERTSKVLRFIDPTGWRRVTGERDAFEPSSLGRN